MRGGTKVRIKKPKDLLLFQKLSFMMSSKTGESLMKSNKAL